MTKDIIIIIIKKYYYYHYRHIVISFTALFLCWSCFSLGAKGFSFPSFFSVFLLSLIMLSFGEVLVFLCVFPISQSTYALWLDARFATWISKVLEDWLMAVQGKAQTTSKLHGERTEDRPNASRHWRPVSISNDERAGRSRFGYPKTKYKWRASPVLLRQNMQRYEGS